MIDLPKTRAEAIAAGSRKYFTGAPCKHGHVSARYTTTMVCLGCASMRARDVRLFLATKLPSSAGDQLSAWRALVASGEVVRHRAHIDPTHPAAAEFLRAVPRLLRERYPHLTDGRLPTMAPPTRRTAAKGFRAVSYFAHPEDRERVLVGLIAETTA